MGSVYRPTRVDPTTGKRIKYKTYRIAWVDANGDRHTRKAFRDKQASEALLAKIERNLERAKAGLPTSGDSQRRRPWSDVTGDYLSELTRRGSPPGTPHHDESKRLLGVIATACDWKSLADVRADAFGRYLADLAAKGRAPRTLNRHHETLHQFLAWCGSRSAGWRKTRCPSFPRPPWAARAGKGDAGR